MHDWLNGVLTDFHRTRSQRQAVLAPRGSAKTTKISKAYTLYAVCEQLERYVLLVSGTIAQAEKNLIAVRAEIETNTAIQRAYPEVVGQGERWNNQRIETSNGCCVEAMGRGSKIRGTTFGPHRPTLIVLDDVDDDESVLSAGQRDKTWEWLTRAVLPAGNETTNCFAIATALHRDDTLQRISKTGGWQYRAFPSIVTWPESLDTLWREWVTIFNRQATENRDAGDPDEALEFYLRHKAEMDAGAVVDWPERETLYELMTFRETIGHGAFEAEKQSSPTSSRANLWPRECFEEFIWFDSWPALRARVMAVDPSGGKSETSDFSVWIMMGWGHDGLLYVDCDMERRDPQKICEDGIILAQQFQPQAIAFESNGFAGLVSTWNLLLQISRGVPLPPPVQIQNHADKHQRIREDLTSWVRGGKFRFLRHSKGAEALVDQLQEFPTGRHDDGPDALQMALRLMLWLVRNTPAKSKSGNISH